MLAQKVQDVKDGFDRVERPCALEYKYDGFRLQIHKTKGKITLFTRRLENVTKQFPEVVGYVKKYVKADNYILDSEAVGFNPKTTQYLPFQAISQRIKRKYDTLALSKKIPVELNVFDLIYINGKNMLNVEFSKRREKLSKIIEPVERKIVLSRIIITKKDEEASKFYNESLDSGNEGVMFKKLNAPYKPGSRVGYMVKLKPVMDSLDLVITGATWGEGKRAKWLTSFTVSCINEIGEFLEIGKVGTGIKELAGEGVTFDELTEQLNPLIVWEKGKEVKVKPKIVVEINFEEIQKSPTYSSKYALRFPRLKVIRHERSPEDISSLEHVEELYFG
jgi:DNA ligase-1